MTYSVTLVSPNDQMIKQAKEYTKMGKTEDTKLLRVPISAFWQEEAVI